MFLCRFFLEVRTRVFHQFAQQRRLYFEFHLLVLHLAEFEQLVHHAQHALAVAVYDLQLTANALTDALRLEDILYRTHDERERRTQLMTDVGEKAQLDIRYLLLHFHALPQAVIDGYRVYRQSDEQGYAQTVEQQSPPTEPYRPLYVNHELDSIVHIGSFAVGGPHMEDVRPVPQVTIGDAT